MKKYLLIITLIAAMLKQVSAQPVFRDPAFGTNGLLEMPNPPDGNAKKLFITGNDRILLVSIGPRTSKLLTDGQIDNSYGTAGTCSFSTPMTGWVSWDFQLDGAENCWILGSGMVSPTAVGGLAKIDSTGNPVAAFGTNGVQIITYPGWNISPAAFDIQSDGRIIVAGNWQNQTLPSINGCFLTRLFPDGTIDTSYGYQGFSAAPLNNINSIYEMEITASNRVLLLAELASPNMYAIIAYDSTGAIDSTYGINSIAELPGDPAFSSNLYIQDKIIQKSNDHTIVIGQTGGSPQGMYTYELDANGFLQMVNNDTTTFISTADYFVDAFLSADDHLYISTGTNTNGTMYKLDALRVQDMIFANNGSLTETGNHTNYFLASTAIQSDQKIVFLANYSDASVPESGNIITRYYNSSVGIQEENETSFNIYPNPASEYVSISLSDPNEMIEQIGIIDVTGKMTLVPYLQNQLIDISGYGAGMYFVQVKTSKGWGVEKLMIR